MHASSSTGALSLGRHACLQEQQQHGRGRSLCTQQLKTHPQKALVFSLKARDAALLR
jgi:hypothetical protein